MEQQIINALMAGQSKIILNNIEVILPTLKRETLKNKERQAKKEAKNIVKLLN